MTQMPVLMEPLHQNLIQPPGMEDPMPRPTMQNYDCPYHIILTNVKMKAELVDQDQVLRDLGETP